MTASIKLTSDRIRETALEVARRNIGFGEAGANNSGRFIELMGGVQGEEWCAIFAGYDYRRAYEILGAEPPDWLYRDGRRDRPEPGARALVKALGKSPGGVLFTDPELALPGDLAAIRRGFGGWIGHVFMIESVDDGLLRTIEGNVGRFPAKVRRLARDPHKERGLIFAGLR